MNVQKQKGKEKERSCQQYFRRETCVVIDHADSDHDQNSLHCFLSKIALHIICFLPSYRPSASPTSTFHPAPAPAPESRPPPLSPHTCPRQWTRHKNTPTDHHLIFSKFSDIFYLSLVDVLVPSSVKSIMQRCRFRKCGRNLHLYSLYDCPFCFVFFAEHDIFSFFDEGASFFNPPPTI